MAKPIPLDSMSIEEKLQAMESLWDDLCRRSGGVQSPAWHGEVLTVRDAQLSRGEERIEDWESMKQEIRGKLP